MSLPKKQASVVRFSICIGRCYNRRSGHLCESFEGLKELTLVNNLSYFVDNDILEPTKIANG